MGQVLEALHRLQAVELQLAEIRREGDSKARRVEHHERRLRQWEDKVRQGQLAKRDCQAKLDALQLDVAVREESIGRHRQTLNKAKTNKEYAAILTAMNTEKADSAKVETEILQAMDEIQKLKDEAGTAEADRAKLREHVDRATDLLRGYENDSKPRRDELDSRREECADGIDPGILTKFQRVAEHHDGEAMVPVHKLHPKREEYMCGGCNLKVTLEIVNALQTRDEIQVCKVCGRILFMETARTQGAHS